MTGKEVAGIRSSLGLDPSRFAMVLGIHPSSLYRWEAAGTEDVRPDPLQAHLLQLLQEQLSTQKSKAQREFGDQLMRAFVIGGGLFALFKLLEAIFGKK